MTLNRFIVMTTNDDWHKPNLCYINVVELKPSAPHFPPNIRSREIKQILLRVGPLYTCEDDSPGIIMFERAERVVYTMNHLKLSLEAAELEKDGVSKLFDYLWCLED
jgi:hypothetical protein